MPSRPIINWILGHEAETGWAYANNFQRLSQRLTKFQQVADSSASTDVAIYFDVVIARKYPAVSRKSIVRLGGPRPLDIFENGDPRKLKLALEIGRASCRER